MIDLHCHSNCSDGSSNPGELVQKALAQGLRILSLTDHDTMAGYQELTQAAKNTTVQIIPGIEFSVRWRKYDIHILGYQIQDGPELQDLIAKQNESRIERAKHIASLLDTLGLKDAYEKACQLAGHQRVGRPHFAKLLVDEGMVKDMQAAFSKYLAKGKPAFAPTPWISIEEAVQGINQAQGQAVIAHPHKYGLTRSKLHELIREFKDAGGVGIEVVSGNMTVTQINELAATCLRFDLLASSGSDYHSDSASFIGLGRQRQLPEMCTPIWHNWTI